MSDESIIIVDDHAMMRNGLRSWLIENTRWKNIRLADSIGTAKSLLSEEQSEICIIDVQIGNDDGFALLDFISKQYKQIKCVMYSMFNTPAYVSQAKTLGAKGYVSKASSEEELVRCLESVSNGETFIDEKMEKSFEKIDEIIRFMTKTERRIFQEILKGRTNAQISEMLDISNHSIECYVSRIYDITGIRNREQLISYFSS